LEWWPYRLAPSSQENWENIEREQAWTVMAERAREVLSNELWNLTNQCYLFYQVLDAPEQSDDIFGGQVLADV
jgi:hypothetical protein